MKKNYAVLTSTLSLLFCLNMMAQNPQEVGQWTDPIQLNLVPAAVANLPDGRLLTWSSRYRESRFDAGDGFTYTEIFDPNQGTNGRPLGLNVTDNNHNMFCSGINNLADGRILVAGGGSAPQTTIYDPQTETWSPSDNLNAPRAYQGNVTLGDGTVFTIGGQWDGGSTGKMGELWTSDSGWKSLPGIPMEVLFNNNDLAGGHGRPADHAWVWSAPNGKVFHAGPSEDMHWLDVNGNGSFTFAGKRADDVYSISGTTVMYDVGKILKVGGSTGYGNGNPASDKSYVIDINNENNVLITETVNEVAFSRTHHNSVVLPNGEVMIVGGLSTARTFFDGGSRLNAEIWNPDTNRWRTVAAMQVPRNYHSVSVLLMDGRVFSGGGGLCNQCSVNHEDAEIYSPPYLFDSNGNLADRPEISAPNVAEYNQTFQVQSSDAIASFSFIRMSSATHSVNNEQRRVPVSFTRSGNNYSLNMPDANMMPPGYYMLFGMDQNGVPSIAEAVMMAESIISVTGVEINPTSVELADGRSILLMASMNPINATNQNVNWSSSNDRIATVDANGNVTAVGLGTATITVTTVDGGFTAQTTVAVVEGDGLCIANGTILMERYDNIQGGIALDNLFNSPKFPDDPDATLELNSFEIPSGVADNYGVRVSGYLCAPETGTYYFWVSGDDESRLNLSTDNQPSNIVTIANVPHWSRPGEWNKYTEQRSVGIELVQGLSYYIEAFMKEATGGDNLAVGWRKPSDGNGTVPAEVIPGNVLSSNLELDPDNCTSATGPPIVTVTYTATDCNSSNGAINFAFDDNSGRSNIEFSIDGGNTYSLNVLDTVGSTSFEDLGVGNYSVFVRWGNDECPVNLGIISITEGICATGVELNTTTLELNEGEVANLTATVSPSNAADQSVTWSSSDESIASVDADGRITAINGGTATITVTTNDGDFTAQTEVIVSNLPRNPTQSSPILVDSDTRRVWVVNPDNNSVSVLNANTNVLIDEFTVAADPVSIAKDVQGNIWITARDAGVVQILNPQGTLLNTLNVGRGSQPYGVVNDPEGDFMYVSLFASNKILKIRSSNQNIVDELSIFAKPRALAITADGTQLFVTQFITENNQGKIANIDLTNFELESNVNIAPDSFSSNTSTEAKGIANYFGGIAIQPDSDKVWFTSKKDNTLTGSFRSGEDLNFATTIRATISNFSISLGQERAADRMDIDNHSLPTGVTISPLGNYVFVTMLANNRIVVFNANNGQEVLRRDVGFAPSGLIIDPTNNHLFVKNFLSRSVHVFDADELITLGSTALPLLSEVSTVTSERLSNQVLQGKRMFYNARDSRMTQQENSDAGYISCASCHIDGTDDGQTWDFTQRGEGLRNTISLRGRSGTGHGNVHWTGNFDEIHDFENDIRFAFGGTGFMTDQDFFSENRENPLGASKEGSSAELDALKAYIESLNSFDDSPNKNENGTLTAAANQGKTLFNNLQCASCHSGQAFTNSAKGLLHDIGTVSTSSGKRLGRSLQGFDVPTLRDVWATAPYLHDGSAATVQDAITRHAATANLSQNDLQLLEAYLLQLDGTDAPAPEGINFELQIPSAATTDASVSFSVSTNMPNIDEVIYYVDDAEIGRSSNAPYTLNFSPNTANNYCVYAKATHQGMATVSQNQTLSITDSQPNTNNDRLITLEGEDFELNRNGSVGTYLPGFRGTGFLDLTVNNSFGEWQFNSNEAESVSLTIVYNSGFIFNRMANIEVNGNNVGEIEFTSSANCFSWQSVRLNNIALEDGLNTVRITTATEFGGVDIDFLEIEIPTQPVTNVTVSPTTLNIEAGETSTITASIVPADADDQEVTWSSADSTIATVDADGLVTGVAAGTVVITATSNDGGFEATSSVTVTAIPIDVTGISIAPQNLNLVEGDTQRITATVSPSNADDASVSWQSSDTSIATVNTNGLVRAIAAGVTTITVTTTDGGFEATSNVTVTASNTSICTASGSVLMERYDDIGGFKIPDLLNAASYPDNPSISEELNLFEIPANQGDNYGVRVSGYLCAPETGTYYFWVAGNNHSEVSLSSNDNVSSKVRIAYHEEWASERDWDKFPTQKSTGITLNQGDVYYIEALMKEGGFGDNLSVGWRKPSDGDGVVPVGVIPGNVLSPSVREEVAVSGISVSPQSMSLPQNEQTVLNETISPVNATNSNVIWSSSNPSVASVDSNGVVTALTQGTASISVTTEDGGFRASSSITVTPGSSLTCSASGTILMERYDAINGFTIPDLLNAATYPNEPTQTTRLDLFEIPANQADNYGVRVSGYICVPETGVYYFWVAGNNHSELSLSTTDSPDDKVRIAYHEEWASERDWDKFPTQKSEGMMLVKGSVHYVEALMKEGGFGDNLSVGWSRPSDANNALPSEVIPGEVLSPRVTNNVVGLKAYIPPSSSLELSPVPADDYINVNYFFSNEESNSAIELVIFDNLGREILASSLDSESFEGRVNISSLANGVYLLRLKKDEEVLVKRFTIKR